jgi:hypothetical protein
MTAACQVELVDRSVAMQNPAAHIIPTYLFLQCCEQVAASSDCFAFDDTLSKIEAIMVKSVDHLGWPMFTINQYDAHH